MPNDADIIILVDEAIKRWVIPAMKDMVREEVERQLGIPDDLVCPLPGCDASFHVRTWYELIPFHLEDVHGIEVRNASS